jgi:hypothetical protein
VEKWLCLAYNALTTAVSIRIHCFVRWNLVVVLIGNFELVVNYSSF